MNLNNSKRFLIILLVLTAVVFVFVMLQPMNDNAGLATSKGVGHVQQGSSSTIGTGIVKFTPSGGN